MTKGKAWSVEEELRLRELFETGMPVSRIALELSKSEVAVSLKLRRLGLKDDDSAGTVVSSSSDVGLKLPDELPTIEEAARIYAGAMEVLAKGKVKWAELQRWKALMEAAWKYRVFMADLVNYKEMEKQVAEWKRKYEGLASKGKNLPAS